MAHKDNNPFCVVASSTRGISKARLLATTFLISLVAHGAYAFDVTGTKAWGTNSNKNLSGDLNITSSGVLVFTGSGGNSTVTPDSGNIYNAGTLAVQTTEHVQMNGTMTQNGGLAGTLETGGTLNFSGSVTNTTGTDSQLYNVGTLGAAGIFNNSGNTVYSTGTINSSITNGGTTYSSGTLNGNVSNSGTFSNDTGGQISATTVSNSGTFGNNGSITATSVSVSGGTFGNNGTIGASSVSVSGGTFANGGTVNASLTNSGGTVVNLDTGTITSSSTLSFTGGVTQNAGSMSSGTTTSISVGAVLSNSGSLTATTGLTNDGTLQNTGTVNADIVNNGTLSNEATGQLLGDMTNTGTLVNAGTINTTGGTTGAFVNSGTTQNDGGSITATTVNSTGPLANLAGSLIHGNTSVSLGGQTSNAGTISSGGTLSFTGGATQNTGTMSSTTTTSISAGAVVVNSGSLTAPSGLTNGGTLQNSGTVNADTVNNGTLVNSGTGQLLGDMTNTSQLTNSGTIDTTGGTTGAFVNSGTTQNNGGSITATTVSSTGSLTNLAGGLVQGNTSVSLGGQTNNAGTINSDGPLTLETGSTTVNTGTLSSGGTTTVDTGAILQNLGLVDADSGLTNDGTIQNSGDVTADVTNNALFSNQAAGSVLGDFTNAGTLSNAGLVDTTGGTTGAFVNTNIVQNSGTIQSTTFDSSGTVQNTSSGKIVANDYMVLSGQTVNQGNMRSLGDLDMTAGLVVNTGTFSSVGVLTVFDGATLTNFEKVIAQGNLINQGITNNSGTIIGDTFNTGTINSDSGRFVGDLTNETLVNANGATVVTGAGLNTGLINMTDGAFGDTISFGGGLGGDGDYNTEIDLSLAPGGNMQSDYVIVTGGETTGDLAFHFTDLGSYYALQLDPIIVVDADDAFDYTYTYTNSTGLPVGGLIFYSLDQINEDLVIQSQVNPALGGLIAALNLPESLLSPLQFPHDNVTCTPTAYARLTAGRSITETDTDTGFSTFTNAVEMAYSGFEAGVSSGCYGDGDSAGGWLTTFGAYAGLNDGHTQQLAYAIDPFDPDKLNMDVLNTIIDTHFQHSYAGVNVATVNGPFSGSAELRFDRSRFDIDETVVNGLPLGVDGQVMKADSITFAAQTNYRFDLNDKGLSLTPNFGISHTRTESGRVISFDTGETLSIDNFDTTLVTVGATLAKTMITAESVTSPFVSLAYFEDVAGDRTSIFTDQNGTTQALNTTGIGGYGQLSIGVDYRMVKGGTAAPDKTLSIGLRADHKFGEGMSKNLDLVAEIRFTF